MAKVKLVLEGDSGSSSEQEKLTFDFNTDRKTNKKYPL